MGGRRRGFRRRLGSWGLQKRLSLVPSAGDPTPRGPGACGTCRPGAASSASRDRCSTARAALLSARLAIQLTAAKVASPVPAAASWQRRGLDQARLLQLFPHLGGASAAQAAAAQRFIVTRGPPCSASNGRRLGGSESGPRRPGAYRGPRMGPRGNDALPVFPLRGGRRRRGRGSRHLAIRIPAACRAGGRAIPCVCCIKDEELWTCEGGELRPQRGPRRLAVQAGRQRGGPYDWVPVPGRHMHPRRRLGCTRGGQF